MQVCNVRCGCVHEQRAARSSLNSCAEGRRTAPGARRRRQAGGDSIFALDLTGYTRCEGRDASCPAGSDPTAGAAARRRRRAAAGTTAGTLELGAAHCLLEHGALPPAGELLALLEAWHRHILHRNRHVTFPLTLYAPLVARQPLAPAEWARVPSPCPRLAAVLPAVLERSEAEAALLVRRLPPADRKRLRTRGALPEARGAAAPPEPASRAAAPAAAGGGGVSSLRAAKPALAPSPSSRSSPLLPSSPGLCSAVG